MSGGKEHERAAAWSVVVRGENATRRLAARLGRLVAPGAVIVLEGDLGAGKTTFVKGLAQGLGVDPADVSSPTFTLVHEYEGTMPLYHFDVYRLEDSTEFVELGAEEYMAGRGVTVVEWGGRVRDELPERRLEIVIERTDDEAARRIAFRPHGEEAAAWTEALRRAWREEEADGAGAGA